MKAILIGNESQELNKMVSELTSLWHRVEGQCPEDDSTDPYEDDRQRHLDFLDAVNEAISQINRALAESRRR